MVLMWIDQTEVVEFFEQSHQDVKREFPLSVQEWMVRYLDQNLMKGFLLQSGQVEMMEYFEQPVKGFLF